MIVVIIAVINVIEVIQPGTTSAINFRNNQYFIQYREITVEGRRLYISMIGYFEEE